MSFEPGVEASLQALFRRMWINRFKGFHARDIGLYLGLDVPTTRYVSAGRKMTERGFRMRARLLFTILAVLEPLRITMTAEQLDAETARDGERYLNRGVQVYMLHGWPFRGRCWMFRQSRMRVWFADHEGVWGWDEGIEDPLKRSEWIYRRVVSPEGEEQFVRAGAAR
jgi:hypothetical protein